MSWRAISEGRRWVLAPADDALLAEGTLLVEVEIPERPAEPVTLVDYRRREGWTRRLRIALDPPGRLTLVERQGPSEIRAELELPLPVGEVTLRVFYGWDAPTRRAVFGAELPETGHWARVEVADPHPIPEDDLARLAELPPPRPRPAPRPALVAWSGAVEPVGPMPGLTDGTPVETAAGFVAVEKLRRGDLVRTSENGFQPVLGTLARTTPAAGHYAPVLLASPALGLAGDVVVSPDHRMLIGGADAEYLFNADAVLVAARHLLPIAAVPLGRPAPVVRYHQVILERHECISVAGAWGESQFLPLGPDGPGVRSGTVLEGLGELPRHERAANPMLQPFEAVVLVSAIGA